MVIVGHYEGATLGAVVGELLRLVLCAIGTASKFESILKCLESTLNSLIPKINEIKMGRSLSMSARRSLTGTTVEQLIRGIKLILVNIKALNERFDRDSRRRALRAGSGIKTIVHILLSSILMDL
ncbi:hypothetical protein L1049_016361 [Liquidambar formosana]|uniref:RPW8 domain-containing protein n=1 Tax=Liquidambar formosana TaxID=63359 RepID=A0AAP0RZ54_LIQFO